MVDVLTDERAEALRRRLGVPDLRTGTAVERAAAVQTPQPRPPLPRQPKALAKAVARRYVAPVARPVLHRVAQVMTPAVSSMVAARLLGRLEPEIARLSAEVEVMKAEVAAMAAHDGDAAAGASLRTRRRLDDLAHRLQRLEECLDKPGEGNPTT